MCSTVGAERPPVLFNIQVRKTFANLSPALLCFQQKGCILFEHWAKPERPDARTLPDTNTFWTFPKLPCKCPSTPFVFGGFSDDDEMTTNPPVRAVVAPGVVALPWARRISSARAKRRAEQQARTGVLNPPDTAPHIL